MAEYQRRNVLKYQLKLTEARIRSDSVMWNHRMGQLAMG